MYLKLNGSGRVLWERLAEPGTERRARAPRSSRRYDIDEARADGRRRRVRRRPAPARARRRVAVYRRAALRRLRRRLHRVPASCRRASCSTTLHVAGRARRRRAADPVGARCRGSAGCSACRLDLTPAAPRSTATAGAELPARSARQLRCTRRVVDVWPFSEGPCLRQSLVAGHLLRDADPAVRLGVAGAGDGCCAHAWVEIDGQPLEDVSDVRRAAHRRPDARRVTMATPRIYEQCGMRLRVRDRRSTCRRPPVTTGTSTSRGVPTSPSRRRSPPRRGRRRARPRRRAWWYTGDVDRVRVPCCGSTSAASSSSPRDLAAVEIAHPPADRAVADPARPDGRDGELVLLTLRGATVLHASGVARRRPGAGVRRAVRAAARRRSPRCCRPATAPGCVTDDVLTVDPGPPPTCLGGASELRLREAAAPLADDGAGRGEPGDGRRPRGARTLSAAPAVPHPLAAIVVPTRRGPTPELQLDRHRAERP